MDINQVRFGSYSIGNSNIGAKKDGSKSEEKTDRGVEQQNANSVFNADDMFSAMNIAGLQNKAQINFKEQKEVNPLEHLSADRIADIEAMMGEFENGVNDIAAVIDEEFPGMFEPDAKYALAAKMYAQE